MSLFWQVFVINQTIGWTEILTWWWHRIKGWSRFFQIHLLGTMNVFTKSHSNPSNNCWNVSIQWTDWLTDLAIPRAKLLALLDTEECKKYNNSMPQSQDQKAVPFSKQVEETTTLALCFLVCKGILCFCTAKYTFKNNRIISFIFLVSTDPL